MKPRSSGEGFTLIELLVVIAIIAVLAAILFPVFAKAREKARQSTCSSNQRQIAAAILMFAQDHEETFPASLTVWKDINVDAGVLQCPTRGKKVPNAYGYNRVMSYKAIGELDDPMSSPLTCDTWNLATNILVDGGDIDRRHSGKTIASYADGHVVAMDMVGLVTYEEKFSASSLSSPYWTFPANPAHMNARIQSSGSNYYLNGWTFSGCLDGATSFYRLPGENIIRGNFKLEMDMMITGSALTPIFLQNGNTGTNIAIMYHHNSGNDWRFNGASFSPGLFFNSGSYAIPYNVWGRIIFTRLGNQIQMTAKPLTTGTLTSWTFTCSMEDVTQIGYATRFNGAGYVSWDNVKCTQ